MSAFCYREDTALIQLTAVGIGMAEDRSRIVHGRSERLQLHDPSQRTRRRTQSVHPIARTRRSTTVTTHYERSKPAKHDSGQNRVHPKNARERAIAVHMRGTYPLPARNERARSFSTKKTCVTSRSTLHWEIPRRVAFGAAGGWPSLVVERVWDWLAGRRDRRLGRVVECGLRP